MILFVNWKVFGRGNVKQNFLCFRVIDEELFITFDDGRSSLKALELNNTEVTYIYSISNG